MKSSTFLGTIILMGSSLLLAGNLFAGSRDASPVISEGPTVFVTSQGLYFDSIVVVGSLPQQGNFQQLIPTENGLTTEFGPGQPGHLGGRWWIDVNGDSIMDADDKYFLCPLLGPGRETL